jgi:hypothetical protein
MKIELLYFDGCPDYEAFASHLDQLLNAHGIHTQFEHVPVTTREDAERLRFLGSPTLRVNGCDVDSNASERTDYGLQCRLYRMDKEFRGTPLDEWILEAIDQPQEHVQ